jgi:hypothetical protein
MTKEYFYTSKNNKDGFNPYCKTCTKNKSYQWIKDNVETHRSYKRTEKAKEASRLTKRKNDQKYRNGKSYQDWVQSNKLKQKAYREKRKDKIHEISKTEWINCKNYFNSGCGYCGKLEKDHFRKWKGEYRKSDLHKEHVDDSGANDLSNCIPSCLNCNSSKWNHNFEIWYKKQPFFSIARMEKIEKWLNSDYKLFKEVK